MRESLTDQTLALAGLAQAACLVQQVARQGQASEAPMAASIASIFKIDADDAADVYGGVAGVKLGLRQLLKQLGGPGMDPEQANYAATLLILERKFMADSSLVETVQTGIRRIALKIDNTALPLDDALLAELALLYQQTVSTLTPKVMVGGEPMHLRQARNTDQIRALLLAGLRSAVLWRQCGGNRLKLFFQRRRILDAANALLTEK